MTHTQTAARLLVVGQPGVGKSTILKALGCTSQCQNGRCLLQLDTKYYTVDVDVEVIEPSAKVRDWTCPDGLLLVVDASDENTYGAVHAWAAGYDLDQAEVRLLIANKADQCNDTPCAWRQAAVEWCVDEGFEYVSVAAAAPEADAKLASDEDQQGMARVRAALEANMWPGLEYKGGTPGRMSAQKPAPSHLQDDAAPSSSREPPIAAAAGDGTAGPAIAAAAGGAGQQDAQPATSGVWDASENPFMAGLKPPDDVDTTDQDEADLMAGLDNFERLLSEMTRVRETAANLPDKQRRDYVAAMVAQMAGLMGLEDEEDSE